MNVAELKEILKNLPDDMEVIVSEKFGRGGKVQGYIIGELKDGCYVDGVQEGEVEYHKQKIKDANDIIKAIKENDFFWDITDDESTSVMLKKSDKKFLIQIWSSDIDNWTPEKTIRHFEKKIKDTDKEINKILKRNKKIIFNAIELSCDF